MTTPDTDVHETSDEALAALERANTPPPPAPDPAVIARRDVARRALGALLRESAWRSEIETWLASRPVQRVLEGVGMVMGEPMAGGVRPVRLVDEAVHLGLEIIQAPRREALERIDAELAGTTDPAVIERLSGNVQRAGEQLRQARADLPAWRLKVQAVEDEVRQMATKLQTFLADCERARGERA